MIDMDSLTDKWISHVAKRHKADPILVEKMVRALYLLEWLQQSDLSFIFKGGTAMMLLMPEPKRFSIDLDVIVSKKPSAIRDIFDEIIKQSDFIEYAEDEREIKSAIKKAHYKFYYRPVTNTRAESEYILLDILYEQNYYGTNTQDLSVRSPFLKTTGKKVTVSAPNVDALLGDKLTAFAPNTTGVPYDQDKEIEIIKQLYDIGHLFDISENAATVAWVFRELAKKELEYRNLPLQTADVCIDIIETAIVIGTRGKSGKGKFDQLHKGIKNIRNFIFTENFHLEKAMVPAAKAAYLSAIIQTGTATIQHFKDPHELEDWKIDEPFTTRLNKLKKSNPEAFFYWYQAYRLLSM